MFSKISFPYSSQRKESMIEITKISNQISLYTNLTKVQKLEPRLQGLGIKTNNLLTQEEVASSSLQNPSSTNNSLQTSLMCSSQWELTCEGPKFIEKESVRRLLIGG